MEQLVKRLHFAYFPSKPIILPSKWDLLRGVAENLKLSTGARLRLEWIIFYSTVGKKNVTQTAGHFGISRKTLHKWLKRFDERNLRSLEERPRVPIILRTWMVTLKEQERIVALRKKHLKYGKKKLKVLYKRKYKEEISTWKIERVIRRYQLFPDKQAYKKRLKKIKARKKNPKKRIHTLEKKEKFGFLWHIDAIILWWYGARRVIFTALEELTKIAYARIYTTNSSGYAEDFLKRLMYLVEGKIKIIHSDNGSEFAGNFEKACQTLGIEQVYSRAQTPKDNPSLERFNWTVQDEWLALSEIGLDDIILANKDLTNWLVEYNAYRPHETLDYQTPLEYAQFLDFFGEYH
jgi:transposase-like protein